jgi:hypothetical protein
MREALAASRGMSASRSLHKAGGWLPGLLLGAALVFGAVTPCTAEVNDTELIAGVMAALPDEYVSVTLLDESMCSVDTHIGSEQCAIAVSYVLPTDAGGLSDLGYEVLKCTHEIEMALLPYPDRVVCVRIFIYAPDAAGAIVSARFAVENGVD